MNVYDYKYFFPNPIILIPLVILGFGVYCLCNLHNPFAPSLKRVLMVGLCCIIIGGICFFACAFSYWAQYKNVYLPYKNGNYEEAEGYVSDFHAAGFLDSGADRFTVDHREFVIGADLEIGYKRGAAYGGAINRNGLYVKIRYVPYKDSLHIMRLDIFPEKDDRSLY